MHHHRPASMHLLISILNWFGLGCFGWLVFVLFSSILSVYGCWCGHAAPVWRSEDSLQVSVLSPPCGFQELNSGHQLGAKHLCLLTCLTMSGGRSHWDTHGRLIVGGLYSTSKVSAAETSPGGCIPAQKIGRAIWIDVGKTVFCSVFTWKSPART